MGGASNGPSIIVSTSMEDFERDGLSVMGGSHGLRRGRAHNGGGITVSLMNKDAASSTSGDMSSGLVLKVNKME